MENAIKNLKINKSYFNEHIAIPFTLNKKLLVGGVERFIISWNTAPRFFPEDMKDATIRLKYVMDNAKYVGLDDLAMPDQPTGDKLIEACHEITFDEFSDYYQSDIAYKQGTIWNVDKNYTAIFMNKDTHDRVKDKFNRSISLVYPAADCAVVRFYDKKNNIIGLTHSDAKYTGENIVAQMTDYMKEHFGSDLADLEVYVGAFANDGWTYTGYPKFAATKDDNGKIITYNDEWKDYIEKVEGTDDTWKIAYGDKLYDQLVLAGIYQHNIYFSPDNTLFNESYFSHVRSATLGEAEGRNLFGITFDGEELAQNSKETGVILR